MRMLACCVVLTVLCAPDSRPIIAAQGPKPVLVTRADLVQAMKHQQRLGYNLLATANGARFSSGIILELARHARATDPNQTPILIDHDDYFESYLEVTGIPRNKAPTFMRIHDPTGISTPIWLQRSDGEADYIRALADNRSTMSTRRLP